MPHRILIADDDDDSREGLAALVASWGHEVDQAADGQEALQKALEFLPAVIVTDLVMPGLDGLALLKTLHSELPSSPVILLTGHGTVESAVAAVKEGAYDYLTKPLDVDRLCLLLEKAVEQADMLREVTLLRRQLKESRGLGPLVGTSAPMQQVYHLVELAAATAAPVLILGESGTGKELVARTIHELSARSAHPFVAVNCAAIPESLLENELFGHERGAFTGALTRRAGYFELADKGTIFLDEISEMDPAVQAKYLRTLQDGTVRRLGGHHEVCVDLRVIAATNRDPVRAIKEGSFREDLYYRLNVFSITVPPLRERMEDLPALAEVFLDEFSRKYSRAVSGLDDRTIDRLTQYRWPGNVRELRNWIERAVVGCTGDRLLPEHLPPSPGLVDETPASPQPPPPIVPAPPRVPVPASSRVVTVPVGTTCDEAERRLVLTTLASVDGNRTRAAEILGLAPKTLYNKLKRYRLEGLGPGVASSAAKAPSPGEC